jgi:MFS family permease
MDPIAGIPGSPTTPVNRWLIPAGAVAVHICIGSVYGWSTLNRPILAAFPHLPAWLKPPYINYTPALVLLGLSAAFGGPWVERKGPRTAALAAAIFFVSGLAIGGLGIAMGLPFMVFLGMGVIGGIGCGLGYIAPVSTLVKWFPDRRGMATGMAIMGFGGGASIFSLLSNRFIKTLGLADTLLVMAAIYLPVMLLGAWILRRPPAGWKPAGWTPAPQTNRMIATRSLNRNEALRTPQFYLLWAILFINVTAGIGIISQASPMVQDMFGRSVDQAAALVALISVFNAAGRFFWASCSDFIGRRNTYTLFFAVQFVLFLLIPGFATQGAWGFAQAALCTIISMYGGGFATIPAFLADIFGPENVGAIHGAILTAWSAAAVAGPVIITEISSRARAELAPGASKVNIYDPSLHVVAAGLAVGFLLTLLVRPLKIAQSA